MRRPRLRSALSSEASPKPQRGSGPIRFRKILERLGPTFIKAGQFLALRPDLIREDFSNELMGLLDDVPPFPWQQARAIFEEDIGPLEDFFDVVNPRPVATGSLAQTHIGRLKNGREVAIKILRPGIHDSVARDLRKARVMARLLKASGISLIVSPKEFVDELGSWLQQELDLRRELINMRRLRRLAFRSREELIPLAYPQLSSSRVVTAEYLRGIPLSEVLGAMANRDSKALRKLSELQIDWRVVAANLVRTTLRQMFDYQFFHADVHPGNLLLMDNGNIGYVDFGLCEDLDESVRADQVRYMAAVYSGEPEQIFRALTEILIAGVDSDRDGFHRDFMAATRGWFGQARWPERAKGEQEGERSPTAHWMIAVLRGAHANRYRVPPAVLGMYRTLLTVETLAQRLDQRVQLRSVGREYLANLELRDAVRLLQPETIRKSMIETITLLTECPGRLNQILADLADGRLALRASTSEEIATRHLRNQRTRLIAAAIVSVGLATIVATWGTPLVSYEIRFAVAALLLGLYAWIFVKWWTLR